MLLLLLLLYMHAPQAAPGIRPTRRLSEKKETLAGKHFVIFEEKYVKHKKPAAATDVYHADNYPAGPYCVFSR